MIFFIHFLNLEFSYFRWTRTCEFLDNNLHDYADNSLIEGWLGITGAGTESKYESTSKRFRIPGTEFKYKCSTGFELPDHTNPDQLLQCRGNFLVDTSNIQSCVPKTCEDTPDLGENSNVEGYTWNNQKLYKTMINISCPVGLYYKYSITNTRHRRNHLAQSGFHPIYTYNLKIKLFFS